MSCESGVSASWERSRGWGACAARGGRTGGHEAQLHSAASRGAMAVAGTAMGWPRSPGGQNDRESGPTAGLARDLDPTAVVADDAPGLREAQPQPPAGPA